MGASEDEEEDDGDPRADACHGDQEETRRVFVGRIGLGHGVLVASVGEGHDVGDDVFHGLVDVVVLKLAGDARQPGAEDEGFQSAIETCTQAVNKM